MKRIKAKAGPFLRHTWFTLNVVQQEQNSFAWKWNRKQEIAFAVVSLYVTDAEKNNLTESQDNSTTEALMSATTTWRVVVTTSAAVGVVVISLLLARWHPVLGSGRILCIDIVSNSFSLFVLSHTSKYLEENLSKNGVVCRAFCNFYKKTNSHDKTTNMSTRTTVLETLSQKLAKDLAEAVKSCWIDPESLVIDKYIGHGEDVGSTLFFVVIQFCYDASHCLLLFQGILQLCGLLH